ncbi:MAG TPA: radical SAM protein [Longimicrobium sp.]|nr:radical SAM protein [Longimicrobium sp.]
MTLLAPRPVPDPPLDDAVLAPPLPRQDPVRTLPIVVLYPHSRCNCRCVMCDIWRARERAEVAPGEVAGWLDEWRRLGVQRVVLSGGEPLMHSQIWELCEVLAGAGIAVTLLSTGLLLRRHARELVRYCDDVVVSVDGPPAVHDAIRRIPGAFAKLADGVAAVKDADPAVRVSGRCTVQRANYRELRATVAAARHARLDRISFLAADVSSEAFNRPGGWGDERASEVALRADDLPLLAEEIRLLEVECADELASGFVSESGDKLRRRLHGHFAALLGGPPAPPAHCNAPWVSTVIEADGTVRPCFFQPPLGNLREAGSLDAVLNSPAARRWRAGLDVERDEICRRCVCSLSLRSGNPELAPAAVD